MEPMWVNYHKHSSLSNRYMKDSPLLPVNYWNELKDRYGCQPCIYTTVEHGWAGNYYKQYDDLEKYNKKNGTNIRWIYGCEAYWVKDRLQKDGANCHIVLLAVTDKGRKAINKIVSIANKDGYYFRPRIDLELLFALPPEDVMITTACVAFWNKYNDIDDIVLKMNNYFKYFYLEVQPHNTEKQKELNKHIIELSESHNIPIIAGCDSHVIKIEQMKEREDLLESGNIHIQDEDGWYMDYPAYDELVNRFKKQNALSENDIKTAIDNTNVIFEFEDIKLDRALKVPVIKELRGKTQSERNKVFEDILKKEWVEQRDDINKEKIEQYQKEILHDIKEIESCNMADYFILSYEIMKRGQEKYGGILTPTGRGSAVSMYLNKLLRLTKVDKINSPVLMYSERFLTKERVIDSHTPPDIDNNVSAREPFIQAQRDLIGELGTYDLLSLGTLKMKAAWKMYARAYKVEPQTANEVSQQIDKYELAKKHSEDPNGINLSDYIEDKYKTLVSEYQRYLGIYDTAKSHPCGCLCLAGDIESEIGISLCKSEATGNSVLVANIESGSIDAFGFLKQDYLIVDAIGLTYDIYKEIGIEPYTVNQLLQKVENDSETWDIYANGYTQCVNQVEQSTSTQKVMRYKPHNISELTQFIAAIRPGFQSMYNTFEQRKHFEYGIKALDNLLRDKYCESSFMLYQESLMKVLGFAGFPMSETYTIIKAISKKKDYIIKDAKPKFIKNFAQAIVDTGETTDENKAHELADSVWRIMEDNASYSFNCVSGDTVIKRPTLNGRYVPTIEEMYKIMHDLKYAKESGHGALRRKYVSNGYGMALSMKDGRIYKNRIVNIYKQPDAQTYLLKTKSGKEIRATENHKFPTPQGEKKLSQLSCGDELYIMGNYRHKYFNSRFTVSYENNFPKKGQCGFQKRENGDSVVFNRYRETKIKDMSPCDICGKEFLTDRFEVHHKDFDRTNNCKSNYQWLCCSCHKKLHYRNGRTKQFENGIETYLDEIVSIEPYGVETVYDVEMSGNVGHNFVIDNGMVVCNCSHSYCMAIDSVTIAYLKAHYPLEFYKCVLQRYTDKGEKDKVSLIKQEMLKRGYKLKDIKFGDDNRQFNIDKNNKCIVQTMASIKDMPKSTPEALYEIGVRGVKNRAELYVSLMNDARINKKAIEILFNVGYFEAFASPNRLIAEYEIFQKYLHAKVLTKSNFDDKMLNAIRCSKCYETETEKQFRNINNKKLILAILSNIDIKQYTVADRIKSKIKYLGYCTDTDNTADVNDYIVMEIKTTFFGTNWLRLYNLRFGVEREYKVDKKWASKHKCNEGDLIRVVLSEKPKYKKLGDGSFAKLSETEVIIKCYKVVNKQSS